MDSAWVFPFGQPVLPVVQQDRTQKRVFVLGVYASAVHARWLDADRRQRIGALAVASEPEIFWRGSRESARAIIEAIDLPHGAGRLVPAGDRLNGPSGVALDELFLAPLGLTRNDAWLCDLVPHSCMNSKQEAALQREYDPVRESLGLPEYRWPRLPVQLANVARRAAIEAELLESGAAVVIALGDQPLKWFTSHYGTKSRLRDYGHAPAAYGRLHPFTVDGREMQLLPLVHPRQAAKLGTHSSMWAGLHEAWTSGASGASRAVSFA